MVGGDFAKILNLYTALDEFYVKFYMAELVLALEYLHNNNIIYRDLRFENVYVNSKGYL